mmetsp:Transcript_28883/g.24684  ORF Transcript_28883/g.24684 Transcript_28883/m.24684 type:complete len:87 (-) Transcript_28883:109-369(-)
MLRRKRRRGRKTTPQSQGMRHSINTSNPNMVYRTTTSASSLSPQPSQSVSQETNLYEDSRPQQGFPAYYRYRMKKLLSIALDNGLT